MKIIIKISTLIFLLSLTTCGVVEDLQEMTKKQEEVKQDFEQQAGLKANIGWNITNGRLTEINVIFSMDDVLNRTVSELEKASWPIIKKHFDEDPEIFYITITRQSS